MHCCPLLCFCPRGFHCFCSFCHLFIISVGCRGQSSLHCADAEATTTAACWCCCHCRPLIVAFNFSLLPVLEPNGDATSATACCRSLSTVDAATAVCCPWRHHRRLIVAFDFSLGLLKPQRRCLIRCCLLSTVDCWLDIFYLLLMSRSLSPLCFSHPDFHCCCFCRRQLIVAFKYFCLLSRLWP